MSTERRSLSRRMLEPVAVFFVLGGALLLVRSWFGESLPVGEPAAERQLVVMGADEIESALGRHLGQTGRRPTPEERERLIEAAADEEIVVREALARGLHERDSVVRQRLVRNMRFVGERDEDEDASFRAALALGMHRTDLVVRRRLAERMRREAEAKADEKRSTAEQRRAFLDEHIEDFQLPEQTTLTQVMIQKAAEHSTAGDQALAVLERLRAEPVPPGESRELGLSSLLPWHLERRSDQELAGVFGAPFARALPPLQPGSWSGPVPSSFGLHAVWIYERRESRPARLEEVDEAVRAAMAQERRRLAYGEMLKGLRERYEVRIEDAPVAEPAEVGEPADAPPVIVWERKKGARKKR